MVIAMLMSACNAGSGTSGVGYVLRTRAITVTTVPLMVKEATIRLALSSSRISPKGGVLEGKEVYGFSPSTLTVVEGDTIQFTFYSPEDDVHSFLFCRTSPCRCPDQTRMTAT